MPGTRPGMTKESGRLRGDERPSGAPWTATRLARYERADLPLSGGGKESAGDLGEVGDGLGGGADAVQEPQAVFAELRIVGVHRHRIEERIDGLAQERHGAHGGFEILVL